MANQYRLQRSAKEIIDSLSKLGLPVGYPEGLPRLEAKERISAGEVAPIVRMGPDGAELVLRKWSWPSAAGAAVFNFRSEGRPFPAADRCVIPVDGFYEFTSTKGPGKRRDRWLFRMTGEGLFFIAGYMQDDAWAMLTTPPGPDTGQFNSRQVVALTPAYAAAWLRGISEEIMLQPAPAGSLQVELIPKAPPAEPAGS